MHVGIGGAGGVGGRSYRSSISESHTAVPAPLPLPALPGAPGAGLGACPGFGMGRLMLCPGNPAGSRRGARAALIRCLCQPFPAAPVPGSVPVPGLGFSVRKLPWIPQSDRIFRNPCPVCGSLHPGSQLPPCCLACQKRARSLFPQFQRILLPSCTGPYGGSVEEQQLCPLWLSTLLPSHHLCTTLIRNNYNNRK